MICRDAGQKDSRWRAKKSFPNSEFFSGFDLCNVWNIICHHQSQSISYLGFGQELQFKGTPSAISLAVVIIRARFGRRRRGGHFTFTFTAGNVIY
jgi:hypothetical protein